jgi:RNA polymerase sigma factor (sigma-70 family)
MEKTLPVELAETMNRFRAGDTEAFVGIIRQYQSAIVGYLYRMTGDGELARDLAQDTFLQAYQSLAGTTPDLPLKTWLYRIATNNALRHHRRRVVLAFISWDDIRRPDSDVDVAKEAFEAAAVHEALLKVPEKLRACLVLHLVDGFKHREIAQMLGISEDAVRMRVARGSEEFRKQYRTPGGND